MPSLSFSSDPVLFGFYCSIRDDELAEVFAEFCNKYSFYAEVFHPNPKDNIDLFQSHPLMKTSSFVRFPLISVGKSMWFFENELSRLCFLAIIHGMERSIKW